jgi:hypothetical protein
LLGTHYWKLLASPDPLSYLDVGPTSDFSVNGLPRTDNRIQFEDLMMFAINFMQVSLLASPSPANELPRLSLRIDDPGAARDVVTARLFINDNTATVKGIHAAVKFEEAGLALVGVTRGALLDGQAAPIFFESLGENGIVNVDLAALGTSQALAGSGELAVLTFSAADGAASQPRLAGTEMRDRNNRAIGLAVTPVKGADQDADAALPVGLRLDARPNPFAGSTDLAFSLPTAGNVSLKVYDVRGQLVATVADGAFGAGEHRVSWSCRDSNGRAVAPGVYVAVLRAGGNSIRQKLSLLP